MDNNKKVAQAYEDTLLMEKMKQHFDERTNMHIGYVKEFWRKLYNSEFANQLPDLPEIYIGGHDQSKFEEPEYSPYLFISWKYEMQKRGEEFELDEEMVQKTHEATTHHVTTNAHHPAYWDDNITMETNVINQKDRDKPSGQLCDGTKMPNGALCEMLCDWSAVSKERGGSPHKWMHDNIVKTPRWKFTDEQLKFMKSVLNFIWPE